MPNVTLTIPEELHAIVKKHNEVSWSEVARRAMWDYAKKLELLDKLTGKSTLTANDVEIIDKRIKAGMYERYRNAVRNRHK